MDSAWLGLTGALIGSVASILGTLLVSRMQWRQELARWAEQRDRDALQWERNRQAEEVKSNEIREQNEQEWRRQDAGERSRQMHIEKIKHYLDGIERLMEAGSLDAATGDFSDDAQKRACEQSISATLRLALRSLYCIRCFCGKESQSKVSELVDDVYFVHSALLYEGLKDGHMIRQRNGKKWILAEVLDSHASRLAEIMRRDVGTDTL
ncbi:hypothetical protein AB0B54_22220 [Microbispora bryophytorum]|uniref:hypothetical protein n=1 Tax=Microbispora bryophytorum TaxID=1460882 RepID=UPI003404ED75